MGPNGIEMLNGQNTTAPSDRHQSFQIYSEITPTVPHKTKIFTLSVSDVYRKLLHNCTL